MVPICGKWPYLKGLGTLIKSSQINIVCLSFRHEGVEIVGAIARQ